MRLVHSGRLDFHGVRVLRVTPLSQSEIAWSTLYPSCVIINFTFMNASVLLALVDLALKNTKCDFVVTHLDGEVILALGEGRFAQLLHSLDLEASEEASHYESDEDLVQEAMTDGFFKEFPEALPALAKRWESEAGTTGTGWTGGL